MSKNRDMGIYFYMQEVDKKGDPIVGAPIKDLENDFDGLLYSKASGLNKKGKARVYKENYSDSDRVRVHIPSLPTNEPTHVTFSFLFVGEGRYDTYNSFVEYVSSGFHSYWDTKRKRRLVFYVEEEIEPAEEAWYGSTPYLKLELRVENVFGRTFEVND